MISNSGGLNLWEFMGLNVEEDISATPSAVKKVPLGSLISKDSAERLLKKRLHSRPPSEPTVNSVLRKFSPHVDDSDPELATLIARLNEAKRKQEALENLNEMSVEKKFQFMAATLKQLEPQSDEEDQEKLTKKISDIEPKIQDRVHKMHLSICNHAVKNLREEMETGHLSELEQGMLAWFHEGKVSLNPKAEEKSKSNLTKQEIAIQQLEDFCQNPENFENVPNLKFIEWIYDAPGHSLKQLLRRMIEEAEKNLSNIPAGQSVFAADICKRFPMLGTIDAAQLSFISEMLSLISPGMVKKQLLEGLKKAN